MRQIITILWDSYRLLAAKKLFWIALFISVFFALMYASIGFDADGVFVLFGAYHFDNEMMVSGSLFSEYLYMNIFTDYLVPWWLGLFSLVLALLSVCPIFPDFLKSGSVDVAVSKPISRWVLFLVKYLGGLLFVAIQVFVFCLIVFFAQGWRIDSWNLQVFWAVPLLTFVFSLIYCVAVLTAVLTRSTLFSLLMALIMWALTLGIQWAESMMYKFTYSAPSVGVVVDGSPNMQEVSEESLEPNDGAVKFYKMVKLAGAPLPKTREVTYMLKKKMTIRGKQMTKMSEFLEDQATPQERREAKMIEDYETRHSDTYIIASSLGFELVILGLAGFLFVRKDF